MSEGNPLAAATPPAFADEAAFAALYFGVYEALKHTDAFRPDEDAGPLQRFGGTIVCGGLAGVAMWCACLPIDNLKTQIQTIRPGSAADLSLVGHLRRVVRLRGVAGLYAGLAPTIVRAFPANAAQVRPGARRGPLDPSAERRADVCARGLAVARLGLGIVGAGRQRAVSTEAGSRKRHPIFLRGTASRFPKIF